jgi:hypothetical protein
MAYPEKEIGELFNELDGFEVAIFQTDWENPFGNIMDGGWRLTVPVPCCMPAWNTQMQALSWRLHPSL